MKRNFLFMASAIFLMVGITVFSACDDDEGNAKPSITLTNSTFTGKVGEKATTTANVTAEGGFKSLKITKYIGTTVDNTFGTNGTLTVTSVPYTLEYTLTDAGLSTPVRFNFVAEDNDGQTNAGSVDFVVTTEVSLRYVLTEYNWRWDSKFGQIFAGDPQQENIEDCEKDNIFSFNDDGTLVLDYGTLTGAGGGTCDYDGLEPGTSWSLDEATNTLTLTFTNVFTGVPKTEVYKVTSFSATEIKSLSEIDLTFLGGVKSDWTFTWKAQAK